MSAEGAIFFQSDLRPADDHTPTLTSIIVGDLATTKASEFPSLPGFTSTSDGAFTWRSMDLQSFPEALISAYQETVNWESNSFRFPFGKFGINFISELARLFRVADERSSLEGITVKAALVL